MKHIKFVILMLVTILIIASCKEENPTEPVPEESGNLSGQPLPYSSGADNFNGILATIQYEYDAGVPGFPPVDFAMGYAQFGNMVDAGTVSVNNTNLSKSKQGDRVFYILPGPGSTNQLDNANFDGSLHQWKVSGSGNIPSFEGEISSAIKFELKTPLNGSTISKNSDLSITWQKSGYADQRILINLVSVNDSKVVFSEEDLADNGVYTIESSKINSLNGEVLIQVVKYRAKEISVNGKVYLIISEVVKSVTVSVK